MINAIYGFILNLKCSQIQCFQCVVACSILIDILPIFFRVIKLCSTTSVPTIPWRCQKQVCLHSLSSNYKVSAEDADRLGFALTDVLWTLSSFKVDTQSSLTPANDHGDWLWTAIPRKSVQSPSRSLYVTNTDYLWKKSNNPRLQKGGDKEPSNPETSTEVH